MIHSIAFRLQIIQSRKMFENLALGNQSHILYAEDRLWGLNIVFCYNLALLIRKKNLFAIIYHIVMTCNCNYMYNFLLQLFICNQFYTPVFFFLIIENFLFWHLVIHACFSFTFLIHNTLLVVCSWKDENSLLYIICSISLLYQVVLMQQSYAITRNL